MEMTNRIRLGKKNKINSAHCITSNFFLSILITHENNWVYYDSSCFFLIQIRTCYPKRDKLLQTFSTIMITLVNLHSN